jgi:hypothetical protein
MLDVTVSISLLQVHGNYIYQSEEQVNIIWSSASEPSCVYEGSMHPKAWYKDILSSHRYPDQLPVNIAVHVWITHP